MTVADFAEHVPGRPSWDCTVCGKPWPCAPAKVQLAEEYRESPLSLSVYLSSHLHDALTEAMHAHEWGRVDDLFERFLGWHRR